MKRTRTALLLAFALAPATLRGEPCSSATYAQLNEKLFGHLAFLSDSARADRAIAGGILLALGGLCVGLGSLILADGTADSPEATIIGYTALGSGAALGLLSLPVFVIPSAEERTFAAYQRYVGQSEHEITTRYERGEHDFRDLAEFRRRGRIAGGGIAIALGAGSILFSGSIYGAALIGSGLAGLFIPTKAENAWNAFLREKERHDEP